MTGQSIRCLGEVGGEETQAFEVRDSNGSLTGVSGQAVRIWVGNQRRVRKEKEKSYFALELRKVVQLCNWLLPGFYSIR